MMKAIGDNIVMLCFLALVGFFMYGFGWLINTDENRNHVMYSECIAAGMQYVGGNCVR